MSAERVAVVGAGPAGLVAARHLAESGVAVDVYEAASSVGGRVRSRAADGFTLDRGFQVLFTGYPDVRLELDLEALDLRTVPAGAVVCRSGHRSVFADPLRDPSTLPRTLRSDAATVGDLLRLWRLRRELRDVPHSTVFSGTDRSTLEELLDRGFSDAFVERFARPFFGGVTLDRSLSTSKRVFEYVLAVLASGRTAIPADGMGAVTAQLADRAEAAGAHVHTESPVHAVSAGSEAATVTVGGERIGVDAAVVATDPPTARDLTGVEAIPTEGRSCVTQYHTLPERAAPESARLHLDGSGGESADGPNHLLVLSNVAPELAPEGRALLSSTFLDGVDQHVARLDDRTRRSLDAWYPEHNFADLEIVATERVEFAQFAQPPGIHDTLPDVDAPEGRCYLAGEYTRWSSLNAALASGRRAARSVLTEV